MSSKSVVCDWNTMCSIMMDHVSRSRGSSEKPRISALVFFDPVASGWLCRDSSYSPQQRCYRVYSDAKFFDSSKCGRSLPAYCVDPNEADSRGIRLDFYLGRWVVDFCVVIC